MGRRVYEAEVIIDASVSAVWDVLVDFESYPRWNPFTLEVKTSLVVGEPVDMRVRMAKLGISLQQRETIRAVVPEARIVWGTSKMGGVISGEREQTLEALGDGKTRYRTTDVIEGPLGALVFGVFGPSVQVGFDAVAASLAEEVARRSAS